MGHRHLSFSSAIALLALFVALGGGAYALQRGSVGSKAIKDSSIRSKDIRDGRIKPRDIKDESLTGSEVAAGTLGTRELADDSIEGTDVRNGSLGGQDLADGTIDGPDVRDGSLSGQDLADGTIDGPDVRDDSLGGADINEATLAGVAPAGAAGGDLRGAYPNPTLRSGSVGPRELGDLPHGKAVGSTQLIGNGIVTKIALGGPAFSSDVTFDNAADSFTVSVPGVYAITGYVIWDSNPTGRRVVQIQVNNSSRIEDSRDAVGSGRTGQSVSTIQVLEAGDEITLHGQQTSGGDLTTAPLGAPDPQLDVYWIGP